MLSCIESSIKVIYQSFTKEHRRPKEISKR